MKRSAIVIAMAAGVCAIALADPDDEGKSPAEWVAQLGAEHLAEREVASEHLRILGSLARGAVHDALNSPDPEIKFRARQLWKKLRWQVVPGADAEIAALVAAFQKGQVDEALWKDFVKKHGAATIRLAAELRADARQREAELPVLRSVMHNLLETAPPLEIARIIAQSDPSREQPVFNTLLDELPPGEGSHAITANLMQIHIALWNYEKALRYGLALSDQFDDGKIVKQTAIAVDRGKLLDEVESHAQEQIAGEADPKKLCAALRFYIELLAALNQRARIAPLLEVAQKADPARADDYGLKRLVQSLFNANMPAHVVKLLRDARTPLAIYMRSTAHLRLREQSAAETDWRGVETALRALKGEKKEEACFQLGELMGDWNDPRAEAMWQQILDTDPQDSVYDANACFRLAAIAEKRRQYTLAADLYERGLAMAARHSAAILVSSGGGSSGGRTAAPREEIEQRIKKLRATADHAPQTERTP